MRSVRAETPIVETALAALERHLNPLSPELAVLGLFDPDVPADERREMATKLDTYKEQWEPGERLIYGLSVPGPDFCLGEGFWRGNLANLYLNLNFDILQMEGPDCLLL